MELLLKGGILHDPAAGWAGPAEILIRGNKVEAVSGSPLTVDVPVVDLQGKVVLPGLIDMHVHLREPGRRQKPLPADVRRRWQGFTSWPACQIPPRR